MNNTNANNQANGTTNNGVPIQQGYNGQPVSNMGTPMAVPQQQGGSQQSTMNIGDMKAKISSIDKVKAKRISGMVCGVLLLISLFIPYASSTIYGYTFSASIWDTDYTLYKILFLLLGLVPIITFFFQKAKRLSYLTAGFALSFVIQTYESFEGFSGLSWAFYFITLAAVVLIVINVLEDLPEIKSMFGSSNQTVSPVSNVVAPAAAQQPTTGPVFPTVQNVEVCGSCGQPKKNPEDQFCQSCGQRY